MNPSFVFVLLPLFRGFTTISLLPMVALLTEI